MLECTYIALSLVIILILSEHGGDDVYIRTSYFCSDVNNHVILYLWRIYFTQIFLPSGAG
jgi:hypothetical protein